MKNIIAAILVFLTLGCEKHDMNDGKVEPLPSVHYSKYELLEDSNGDGLISKGETVKIKVFIKNTTQVLARQVKVKFSLSNANIIGVGLMEPVFYGNIAENIETSDTSSSTLILAIPNNIEIGNQTVILEIKDAYGESWKDQFDLKIEGLNLDLEKVSIINDTNNDSVANPGESISLSLKLKNLGIKTDSLSAIFASPNTQLTILSNINSDIEGFDVNEEKIMNLTFSIPINYNIPNISVFSLTLRNKYGDEVKKNFSINIDSSYTNLVTDKIEIINDGNNNGEINAGETVWIRLSLRNTGNIVAPNVMGTIYSNLPDNIEIDNFEPSETKVIEFKDNGTSTSINPNESKYGNYSIFNGKDYTFSFKVKSGTPIGTQFAFTSIIKDGLGKEFTLLLIDKLIVK